MKGALFLLLATTALCTSGQSLGKRVVHNDPSKYRQLAAVHGGAGKMMFTGLLGSQAMITNLLYLHAGEIPAKAGIGEHFHHAIEEMYVIFDGEAEFTINGRTSKIKGPAVVPCKLGDAHGIYNSSGKPLRWLNFGVSTTKGRGDNFDLNDDRVGAALDAIPQFVSGQLKLEWVKPGGTAYTGAGVRHRRIFGPEIFSTACDHVDHVVIPPGSTAGPRMLEGIEEVYYVVNGSGIFSIRSDSTPIKTDDAFYGSLGEAISITNTGSNDLELLVVGISTSTKKDSGRLRAQGVPKAMVLQMDFVVPRENAEAFEKMYSSIYVPAMTVQQGYLESKLLRTFSDDLEKEIEGEPTTYTYQIQISFDSEENRRKWVASEQHKIAWPAASGLAKAFKWRGYDVMGDDNR